MDPNELLQLLDLKAKPPPTDAPAVSASGATVDTLSPPAGPTAVEVDAWGLRRGRDLVAESERLRACGTDEFAAADFFVVAFEPEPRLTAACSDPTRHQFVRQLLDTPEYRALHADTKLDDTAAAIAAGHLAEQFARLKKESGDGVAAPAGAEAGLAGEMAALRAVGKAVTEARREVDELRDASAALGLGPGQPGGNDPRAIAEIYRRVRTDPALRRISELAGRFRRVSEFLGQRLKLTLSPEKTLITHATDGMAKFLGYEIAVTRKGDLITANGKRNTNGKITLRMPREVLQRYLERYSRGGKVRHATELLPESDYTIVQRHQSVLRGLYNYYCMAINVGTRKRMPDIKWVLEQSLTKTLACKHRCSVRDIYSRYRVEILGLKALRVVLERPEKEPLIATFGGIPLTRIPEGMGVTDFDPTRAWLRHHTGRSEVVTRLVAGRCELCEVKGVPLEVHHIRKLADINRPGRRPKAKWEQIMSATQRKTIVLCTECHDAIHAGRYDGPSF